MQFLKGRGGDERAVAVLMAAAVSSFDDGLTGPSTYRACSGWTEFIAVSTYQVLLIVIIKLLGSMTSA
jgi:hypothetical protein